MNSMSTSAQVVNYIVAAAFPIAAFFTVLSSPAIWRQMRHTRRRLRRRVRRLIG